MTKSILLFLFVTGLVLRIIFSLLIPDFTGNDEQAHLRYAQHISTEKRLPNLNNYPNENPAGNEYFQPPIYYVLIAPLISITSTPSSQLHLARIISIIIWGIGFYFALKLISIIKLPEPHSVIVLAFTALLPTYIANSSTSNNDTLTNTLSLITLFIIAKLLNQKLTFTKLLILSALISLAILSKLTGLIFLPTAVWLIYYKAKGLNKIFIANTTIFIITTGLFSGWWFLYNFLIYKDFLGPIAASTATFTNIPMNPYKLYLMTRGTFFTFWAAYGPANQIRLPIPAYIFLFVLTVFSIIGFLITLHQLIRKKVKLQIQNKYIIMCLIVFLFNICLLLIFNIRQHQPLGRYLYPSLFAVALFWSIGLNKFLPNSIQKILPKLLITTFLYLNLLGTLAIINNQ